MFSENNKSKYLQILEELNTNHAKIFTQKELSEHLEISVRTVSSFQNGDSINFELLTQYAAIIGRKVNFYLEPI